MKQRTFTIAAPLQQDEHGAVRVAGSRLTLDTVVGAFKRGATAEQIQDSFPSLSLCEIYAVIAYYLAFQNEVEDYLRERQTEAAELQREVESRPQYQAFRERLRTRRAQLLAA